MRIPLVLSGLISVVLAGGLAGAPVVRAGAATPLTLYVNQTGACSDSGPGSQAAPFCTIKAAASVVTAGQTVDIEAGRQGRYFESVVITHSGTPSAPITFVGVPSATIGGQAYLYPASGAMPWGLGIWVFV